MPTSREQFELRKKGLKRCQGPCGQILPIGAFSVVYRVIKSGEKRGYPRFRCMDCEREAHREWRDRQRADGLLSAINHRHYRNIMDDPERREAHRARQRDWARMNDILTGKVTNPVGPWKRYRKSELSVLVDPDLFLEWFQLQPNPPRLTENESRRIRQCYLIRKPPPSERGPAREVLTWMDMIETQVHEGGYLLSLSIIDQVMTRAQASIQVGEFYPPGSEEIRTGAFVAKDRN